MVLQADSRLSANAGQGATTHPLHPVVVCLGIVYLSYLLWVKRH
jgi:hypothetical protein